MTSIETVWSRIKAHNGEEFRLIRGKPFSYSVHGFTLVPKDAKGPVNRKLPRGDFEKALKLVPLADTACVHHLQGPSYMYGILMDKRIRLDDW